MGMASTAGAATGALIVIGLAAGTALGWSNGFLITRFALPSIAVTIGTLSLYGGIASVILGDQAYTNYPAPFAFYRQGYLRASHVPFELVLFVALAAVWPCTASCCTGRPTGDESTPSATISRPLAFRAWGSTESVLSVSR